MLRIELPWTIGSNDHKHFSIPAYTTIRNVFLGIDLEELNRLQREWVEQITKQQGETLMIVAADGKTMRGSSNRAFHEKARHIVSLFLPRNRLMLAHTQVEEKKGEISALIELLEELKLDHCIITMDAIHTQKKHFA